MENGTGRRITVSAIAGTVLAAALAGVVSQTSGYATKASGTDAYLYGMALEAMGNFTDVTGSLPFLAITALAVGAAIYAWGDFVWRAWATRWRSRSRLSLRSPDRKLIAMSLMFIFGGGLALSALWYAGERYLVKSEPTTKRAKVEVKPAITPNIDGAPALSIPKLGTQIAKEDFQKAINDMSKIVGRASDLVKTSSTLAGSRPLIQKDTDNGANLVATLQQLSASQKEVYDALMDGSGGQFFAKFTPTYQQAL